MKMKIPRRGSARKNKHSGVYRQQGRVLTDADWNELVEAVKERLDDVRLSQSKFKRSLSQYRRTAMALFSGSSGVEKSFAALVIANELGWPLLRVDMKQLIGRSHIETEKNLNTLFGKAGGQPSVLYFDEADALFGKRSEVKDAHDRYANMAVSHLLSRIERHKKGLCIVNVTSRQKVGEKFLSSDYS